ncbi:MAG TPA: cellulase family glycosylhydrolase [Ktedonosporobacter sp.]|nr:cellulase family glycosylhydrolase [Ktedonosporobacter sp.]
MAINYRRTLIRCTFIFLVLAIPLSTMIPSGAQLEAKGRGRAGSSCGITLTPSGYVFQWLHVQSGYIVASSGCVINLKGFNLPDTGYGNATGLPPAKLFAKIGWFAQTFTMNVWRVSLNAVWWNEDVPVPMAGMGYRAWIQQLVQVLESNGNYVLLTKGPQFHELPCGGVVTYCPAQNQGAIDIKKDPYNPVYQQQLTTGVYISDAVAMWTSVAALYANDPAVLYDDWNEMHQISPALWRQNSQILIDTIRSQNPQSLIFFGGNHYENGFSPLIRGLVPPLTEPNLVYDFHVYNGFVGIFQGKRCIEPLSTLWADWPIDANMQVGYAQTHGGAASFSEWGGCNDIEPYNTVITQFAAATHIMLGYYDSDMVTLPGFPLQLNSNGLKVQADYASY